MGLTEFLAGYITNFMASAGLPSVVVLMAMESMIFPVPSEAVMPFAGFLVVTKTFSFAGVLLASTLGSLIGSLLSYGIGAWGGKPFIKKYGRYFLINEHHLAATESYFARRGDWAVLISRFIPIIRHLISLPAGVGRMNLKKFILYTAIGASIWNTLLTVCGYALRQNWDVIMRYSRILDSIVITAIIGSFVYFIVRHVVRKKNAKNS